MDEPDVVSALACEFLAVDQLRNPGSGEDYLGLTFMDDDRLIPLCISQEDARILLRQLTDVLERIVEHRRG